MFIPLESEDSFDLIIELSQPFELFEYLELLQFLTVVVGIEEEGVKFGEVRQSGQFGHECWD